MNQVILHMWRDMFRRLCENEGQCNYYGHHFCIVCGSERVKSQTIDIKTLFADEILRMWDCYRLYRLFVDKTIDDIYLLYQTEANSIEDLNNASTMGYTKKEYCLIRYNPNDEQKWIKYTIPERQQWDMCKAYSEFFHITGEYIDYETVQYKTSINNLDDKVYINVLVYQYDRHKQILYRLQLDKIDKECIGVQAIDASIQFDDEEYIINDITSKRGDDDVYVSAINWHTKHQVVDDDDNIDNSEEYQRKSKFIIAKLTNDDWRQKFCVVTKEPLQIEDAIHGYRVLEGKPARIEYQLQRTIMATNDKQQNLIGYWNCMMDQLKIIRHKAPSHSVCNVNVFNNNNRNKKYEMKIEDTIDIRREFRNVGPMSTRKHILTIIEPYYECVIFMHLQEEKICIYDLQAKSWLKQQRLYKVKCKEIFNGFKEIFTKEEGDGWLPEENRWKYNITRRNFIREEKIVTGYCNKHYYYYYSILIPTVISRLVGKFYIDRLQLNIINDNQYSRSKCKYKMFNINLYYLLNVFAS